MATPRKRTTPVSRPGRPAARKRPTGGSTPAPVAPPARGTQRRARNPYSVHPSVALLEDWVASLKIKTGRSLEGWIKEIKANGPADSAGRRDWLKRHHKLGTNSASWLADRSLGKGAEEDTPEGYLRCAPRYVEEMFAGKKAALRPIYDRLLTLGLALGTDVKACPCRTMVPLYRTNVFAQLKPTTNTRLDLGLFLRGQRTTARLLATGGESKGDRITHRIAIGAAEEIDAEVERWLARAYELAGDNPRATGAVKLR